MLTHPLRLARTALVLLTAGLLLGAGAGTKNRAERGITERLPNASALRAEVSTVQSKQRVLDAYRNLPLAFEANQGQADSGVRFLSRGAGYGLFLASTESVLVLGKMQGGEALGRDPRQVRPFDGAQSAALRMQLIGANPNARIVGLDELPGKANYFMGNDPQSWRTDIPTYAKVKYDEVFPGVDLVYYSTQQQLEYDFIVAPGADPTTIRLGFEGVDELDIDAQGDLVIHVDGGSIRLRQPVIYQTIDGARREVGGGFVPKARYEVGFHVGRHDQGQPLVIDPILIFSTFLGHGDIPRLDVDSGGAVYVVGTTSSPDFPTTPGAFDRTFNGYIDVSVTKLNSSGTALIYSTYLGGSGSDRGDKVVVDSSGAVYVVGNTRSPDFPTTPGAFDRTPRYGQTLFVTKLNSTGTALIYSTFLGGSSHHIPADIAIDSSGAAYVVGMAFPDSPTTPGAFDTTQNGSNDLTVMKLNGTGTALVFGTLLGGSNDDWGPSVAVDGSGAVYVSATTIFHDFPTTPGALDPIHSGGLDVVITKLNSTGTALIYSTYLGAESDDQPFYHVIDTSGAVYVTGFTNSPDFPTTRGAFDTTFNGGYGMPL